MSPTLLSDSYYRQCHFNKLKLNQIKGISMKRLNIIAIAITMGLTIGSVNAQPYRKPVMKEYTTQIENQRRSDIQDFRADISSLEQGQVIRFYADGESHAKATVKFNSSGKFWREINLTETEPGRYTGSYTIREVDTLDEKTFTLTLMKGKDKSIAYYKPIYLSERNDQYRDNSYNRPYEYKPVESRPLPVYKNPDFGVVSRIDVQDARPDQLNMGGTALGAIVGGVLGNQVGGGSGKKAATVIGAIAGGAAGNQIGNNVSRQKIWNVSVSFEDGQTAVYQYPNDPQISVGTPVRKEGQGIAHR
jgi:outer membrane lipoprotein SlyB